MLYIAYGSNLNVGQMARRCPRAKIVGPLEIAGWKLVFRGVADIEPSPGSTLQCGIWRITKACEAALDRYEGVSGGLYRKDFLPLRIVKKGVQRDERALVYLMNDVRYGVPSGFYFDAIRQGYKDFSLPEDGLMRALGEVQIKTRPRRSEWDWPERTKPVRRASPGDAWKRARRGAA